MEDSKEIKVLLIGEKGVGKTELFRVSQGYRFDDYISPNMPPPQYRNKIRANNKDYLYIVWDTVGNVLYHSSNKIFIKDSKIVLIIFSINDKNSFDKVNYWYNYVKEILGTNKYIFALIANKSDLYEESEVMEEEIIKKSEELKIKYKYTSAKKDIEGFENFLKELLEEYINKYHPDDIETTEAIKIGEKDKNQKSKNKCNN